MEQKKLLLQKIMRITSLASVTIIAASQFLWAGASRGQLLEKRINLEYNKTTLYNLIEDIQHNNDVDFAFTDHLNLEKVQLSNVHFSNTTVQEILSAVLPHRIVFNEKAGVITLSSLQAPGSISGRITDEKGEPLIGATIRIVELNRSVSADTEGKFKLSAPVGTYTIEVAYISFTAQRKTGIVVEEGKASIVNFAMASETGKLNEVVVVGYGTQKRKEVTSAITSVKADQFNQGSARSPLELIQGKVAGLNITKTQGNNPNSSASIQLRGVTSLTGTTTPLIVIDGIPGGNLDLLQQDDIESFDVLKDGSAAAIYGTRGNAGVILITTKKGVAGPPQYEYNTYFQRDYVNKKPNFLSAAQFREHIAAGDISKASDLGSSTDMYNQLINNDNLSQYHNFSASGGSDKSNYRASLYYNDFEGIAKNNGREQFGGRLNINQKGLKDKLTMQINMVQNFNKANLLGGSADDFEQAVSWNPTAPIQNPDGTYFVIQDRFNPISRFANRINERQQQTFSGDGRLSLELIKNLNISAFASYQRDNYNNRVFRSMLDYDQRPQGSYQGTAYASKENVLSWTKTFEPTISYKKLIGEDHSISGVVGYSYQYTTTERFNVNNNGFTTDGFLDWNLGAGSAINNVLLPRPGMGSFKEDNTLIAFFGRVNYSFKEKYFAQFILRHEGSSRFGDNNKWGNFPAASIGWTLSEESFMKDVTEVNSLKLRIGYGVTGNQGIPNYQSLTTLGTGGVYPQNGIYYQTYGASRNPNPNLRWEKKEEWNFGLDYALLNNRLNGSIDVYSRTTKDLLYNYTAQQPAYVLGNLYTNVGSLRNHGIEVAINAVPLRIKDFEWRVDLTANTQFNKLLKLSNDVFKATFLTFSDIPNPGAMGPAIRLDEGGQVGNFYGKRFAGFTDDGKWLFYKADGSKALASQMNENDKTIIGNGVPKYVLGLNQTFRYKNFDLNILMRGKFGFDILNLQEIFYGNRKYLPSNIFNSAFTTHGALKDDPQYSDYYIEKGDFVKLDNVTLGYRFKLNSSYIRNMRLFVTGRNLLTVTGYKGLDPELEDTGFNTGVDSRGFYPRTISWTAGFSIGF
ncbi:SusC/RagA family TonB-linked outer membrane protein [Mucilaginibacter aquaedulcis]|uniref:SusC/RagA family TonB-linked outer membrane protein n=1 Tax=Mucilaginibacter aquaedulcis TaxID=1187081 RepID=UPI0025B3AD39|nr:SusC/RagA family TonB-linked outer membrane protein [Mucilaginibacter aquaedulcis]MDN3547293.1 SusC/RagA family TonB-linked outer membrane protein [Mucilaginibacter aquaedulcis]